MGRFGAIVSVRLYGANLSMGRFGAIMGRFGAIVSVGRFGANLSMGRFGASMGRFGATVLAPPFWRQDFLDRLQKKNSKCLKLKDINPMG